MQLSLAIQENHALRDTWSWWLVTSQSAAAEDTLRVLAGALRRLSASAQRSVLAKVRTGYSEHVEATLHELVAHELLWRLHLAPEWEPRIASLTPDLAFKAQGNSFLGDVFVAHSPTHAVDEGLARYLNDPSLKEGWAYDSDAAPISRAKKVADRLQGKAEKYAAAGLPLVVFVFLGDHRAFDFANVEQAIYGSSVQEGGPNGSMPLPAHQRMSGGGLLVPRDGSVPLRNLSAVVVCDWFDTLHRACPGRRLACMVLHHWAPSNPLSVSAFGAFPQVTWRSDPVWIARVVGTANLVGRFIDDDSLDLRTYAGDSPW